MLTQVRARNGRGVITLDIHPGIQVKLQSCRLGESKMSMTGSPGREERKGEEKAAVGQSAKGEEESFKSFLKYQSLPSPPQPSRRKARPSSYQLYKQQQKSLRQTHYSKINEWKSKFLSMRPEKQKGSKPVNHFNRTNSFSESRSLHKRQIAMPFSTLQEVVSVKPVQHPQFRSSFIKTSQGRRKMVDNNSYLRKLRARIEFYSLSTIIAERHNMKIKAVEPVAKREEERGTTQESKMRSYIKYGKAAKRSKNGPNGQLQGCRPWSGFKQDFSNELATFL